MITRSGKITHPTLFKFRRNQPQHRQAVREDFFYAATFDALNDPFETLADTRFFDSKIDKSRYSLFRRWFFNKNSIGLHSFEEFAESTRRRWKGSEKELEEHLEISRTGEYAGGPGIYSTSATVLNELLWAHYSGDHTGFCLAYDTERLVNSLWDPTFHKNCVSGVGEVMYRRRPARINRWDLTRADLELSNQPVPKIANWFGRPLAVELLFRKSKAWAYEEEVRIIMVRAGKSTYDPAALKAVYFGARMPAAERQAMMAELAGRPIEFHEITLKDNSYALTSVPMPAS